MSEPAAPTFDLLQPPTQHYGTLRNFVSGERVTRTRTGTSTSRTRPPGRPSRACPAVRPLASTRRSCGSQSASAPAANIVCRRCGETGKRGCANGGAENFITVMPEAEIDRSLSNMMASSFGCTGQRCLAGAVILAVGDVHEEIRDTFAAAARALVTGPGLDETVNVGPVISARSLERIHGYIEQGLKEGAELILDGRGVTVPELPCGHFIGPTVLDRCAPKGGREWRRAVPHRRGLRSGAAVRRR